MWARFRTSKTTKDERKSAAPHESFDVGDEYLDATRSELYADFVAKAQLFFTEAPSRSSSPCSRSCTTETILEPELCLVTNAVDTLSLTEPLSDILLDFFDTSSEASRICGRLLQSINETRANYKFVEQALDQFSHCSPDHYDSVLVELGSFTLLGNPFDSPKPASFGLINDQYTRILCGLNSKIKKIKRRIKLLCFMKKAAGMCLTVVCIVVALVGVGLMVHSISGLLLGPVLIGLVPSRVWIKYRNTDRCKKIFLRKLLKRLDAAAKETYILNRNFDTISRLVERIRDEVEHMKEMIRYCLERREDRFPLEEVVKRLRRRGRGFKKLVVELEEHVCLCLVTINRARVLVMKEMSKA